MTLWILLTLIYTVVGAYLFAIFLTEYDRIDTPAWAYWLGMIVCGPLTWVSAVGLSVLVVLEVVGRRLPWRRRREPEVHGR